MLQGKNVQVKVEVRANTKQSFGRGSTCVMPFHQFMTRFQAGDDTVYLSAQEVNIPMFSGCSLCMHWHAVTHSHAASATQVAVASDGHPDLCAPPVLQLLGDLPLQPQIMGALVPQQINLWMGHAKDGMLCTCILANMSISVCAIRFNAWSVVSVLTSQDSFVLQYLLINR